VTVYRAHNADHGDWHEIVGESGEAGEGCLMTGIKTCGAVLLVAAVVGILLAGTAYTAFSWDLW